MHPLVDSRIDPTLLESKSKLQPWEETHHGSKASVVTEPKLPPPEPGEQSGLPTAPRVLSRRPLGWESDSEDLSAACGESSGQTGLKQTGTWGPEAARPLSLGRGREAGPQTDGAPPKPLTEPGPETSSPRPRRKGLLCGKGGGKRPPSEAPTRPSSPLPAPPSTLGPRRPEAPRAHTARSRLRQYGVRRAAAFGGGGLGFGDPGPKRPRPLPRPGLPPLPPSRLPPASLRPPAAPPAARPAASPGDDSARPPTPRFRWNFPSSGGIRGAPLPPSSGPSAAEPPQSPARLSASAPGNPADVRPPGLQGSGTWVGCIHSGRGSGEPSQVCPCPENPASISLMCQRLLGALHHSTPVAEPNTSPPSTAMKAGETPTSRIPPLDASGHRALGQDSQDPALDSAPPPLGFMLALGRAAGASVCFSARKGGCRTWFLSLAGFCSNLTAAAAFMLALGTNPKLNSQLGPRSGSAGPPQSDFELDPSCPSPSAEGVSV
ncbi:nascent polypeptide-associated complex subunit alpha, muscle-specific form-like [Sarcophilus harrisii]|uniref:nascent polypeptide-associated complex subunit alpha, muscle-specific form-like n=1 Tax=Sarcophilus harrisii TaxID=9305 RepID=UPI001301D5C9|nr:nascent polypeptide-associated complex subunit alpha, muscle-specific form-like [Sarcophilus harrisii]